MFKATRIVRLSAYPLRVKHPAMNRDDNVKAFNQVWVQPGVEMS